MFGFKPPFKLVIVKTLFDGKARDAQAVLEALKPEYAGEKQLNIREIEHHLQALKAVGLVQVQEERLQDGELIQSYTVTDYGRRRASDLL